MKLFGSLLVTLLFLFSNPDTTQTVELTITGIRSAKGKLRIGLFKDQESFKNEKAIQYFEFDKTGLKDGRLTVQVELETGTLGLSLLDDENGDSEMNYNFVGMPKEGFGFSNYYHKGFTRPTFDDFDFELNEHGKEIEIKIRYVL